MKSKLSIFDKLMMAITFAETNEHETARRIVAEKKPAPGGETYGMENTAPHAAACQTK